MEASMAALSAYQISRFFTRNAPVTQEQCNEEAIRLTGAASAIPTPVQGGGSYTVVAGDSVVQFRDSDSALDIRLLRCVEEAYAGFVPHHLHAGEVGNLHVYMMNNIGGVSMYLARNALHRDEFHLLRRTLEDYARFFASAWHNTPKGTPTPSRTVLFNDYLSQLTQLSAAFPARFRPTLDHLISRLPSLFAEDWPMVPNHKDLLENNIHVDPNTGRLTGICDWKDADVSPFGISLAGLETMLGTNRVKEAWCYHDNHQALREVFWDAFYEAVGSGMNKPDERIEVARLVGLFLGNGWKYNDEGEKVPAWEGSYDLAYLDAVVLGNSAADLDIKLSF
ncbi:hypothetical protein BDN70DRAFT_872000 [Pholiota conissans]|uniref:Aminoglycoside phosphotransferase domain-containing protein n=1 Tax=Pholiota conissans TaxID=109636 RepID=A0A9P5ZC67_9AGAR|nr:hypothetical protein BDN70DRAFT_872000 [Pholiota conissans]